MTYRYSESQVISVINHIIAPQSEASLKNALTELQNFQKCSNFIEEFLSFALHPSLNVNQKLLTLTIIQKHLNEKKLACMNLNLLNTIFSIFNSKEVEKEYKNKLIDLMCSCSLFTKVRDDITNLLLLRLSNGEITFQDLYVIYASLFILRSDTHWTNQINFIFQVNPFIHALARSELASFNQGANSQERILLIIKLFKIIAEKLNGINNEQQLEYLNSQITDILHQCLALPLQKYLFEIKSQCFDILRLILIMACEYLSQQFDQIKSILYIEQTLAQTVKFLEEISKLTLGDEWRAAMESCTKIILTIYKYSNIYPTLSFPDRDILAFLLKSISLKKLHYDNYYFNPQDFIDFIHELLSSKMDTQQLVIKRSIDDCLDVLRRFDTSKEQFIVSEPIGRVELRKTMNTYHYISFLIEQICHKNSPLSFTLLNQIIDVLYNQHQKEGLEKTTCMILVGLLKNQISKRPELFAYIQKILQKQLQSNCIPTTYTQEPESKHQYIKDIQFFIIIALAERYIQIFENNHPSQKYLFKIINQVVQSRRTETSLAVLCINVLQCFTHKIQYALSIINLCHSRISSCDHLLIIKQLLSIYRSLMNGVLHVNVYNINHAFHLTVMEISKLLFVWQGSIKFYPACIPNLQLLFQYKSYMQTHFQSNTWNQCFYNEFLNKLIVIRPTLQTSKDLVQSFDQHFLSSFNLILEKQGFKGDKLQQILLMSVLDRCLQRRQSQLLKQFKKMLQLCLGRLQSFSQTIILRMPQLLNMLLLQQSFTSSEECLALTQSFLIIYHNKFDSKQVLSLCHLISTNYLCQQSQSPFLQVSALMIKIFISLHNYSFDECLIQELSGSMHYLNYTCETNQAFICLLSNFVEMLIKMKNNSAIKSVIILILYLLESNIKQEFQCMMTEDQQTNNNELFSKKLLVDEWSIFRHAMTVLKTSGLWEYVRSCLDPIQEEVLRKSLLCETIDKRTRIILKTK